MQKRSRCALIVAHPGHELRLHHWLEVAGPIVFALTDGSGANRESRISATLRVLAATGSRPAAIMGAFPDRSLYRAVLEGNIAGIEQVTVAISDSLLAEEIELVVADSCEFYNPSHDLCRVIANLAVERAREISGRTIESYDYAVVGPPAAVGVVGERVLTLDDAALRRKLEAGFRYAELREDVDAALSMRSAEEFRVESLRPVDTDLLLPRLEGRAFYEQVGEDRVAHGVYETLLEHDLHFVPFVRQLAASFRSAMVVR